MGGGGASPESSMGFSLIILEKTDTQPATSTAPPKRQHVGFILQRSRASRLVILI